MDETISLKVKNLQLENLKCPIHVAIENGQLRVVALMIRRDHQVLEHCDGYGTSPLRLALRNQHTNETKRRNQRDVARFLMGQQFDSKVSTGGSSSFESTTNTLAIQPTGGTHSTTTTKTSNVYSMTMKMRYYVKCWCERARDRVMIKHGIAKSSLPKKKILMRTGLVGNKVLVDGFNNNFKDYPHSYERLRAKYRYYYFKDEEDEKQNGLSELYFRSVGMFKQQQQHQPMDSYRSKRVGILAQSELGLNRSFKQHRGHYTPHKPNPRVVKKWKKAIYRVMLIRVKIKCYKSFVRLGVCINLAGLNIGEISYFAADWKEIKRFNLEMFQSETFSDSCKSFFCFLFLITEYYWVGNNDNMHCSCLYLTYHLLDSSV